MLRKITDRLFFKKESAILSASDLKHAGPRTVYLLILLLLILLSLFTFIPVVWVMLSAFKEPKEFLSLTPSFFPKSFNPQIIWETIVKYKVGRGIRNSLFMVVGCVAGDIVVSGLMGYALSKLKARGIKLITAVVSWTMLLPGSVSMVPLFMTFLDFPILHLNMTNTYIPMWMMSSANAFNILLFKSYFDSIPASYVEAARIDGCTSVGIFFRIIMPLSLAMTAVIGIFAFNGAWGNFLWPYILIKNPELQPFAVSVYGARTMGAEGMVIVMISILPPLLAFLLFHKQIMTHMSIGGVKE